MTIVIILDLTVAFDTVDHEVLLEIIGTTFWTHGYCIKMAG